MKAVTIDAIEEAKGRIAGFVGHTPLIPVEPLGLWIKAESLHPVGSFKIRGAFNSILKLAPAERARGVVAHSSGNHAQAVAYVGRTLGIPATIVMPETAPPFKVAATRRWGAEIVIHGRSSDALVERAQQIADERSVAIIEPFDAEEVIAGTGTIGLEVMADLPDVEQVFVPVSGGGLLSGVAAAIKQRKPSVRIIGVEPELGADATQSFHAGRIIGLSATEAGRTIADGLRVQRLSELTWHHIHTYADEMRTVSDDEIEAAMRFLASQARLVAEPSGAAAIAAALREPMLSQRRSVAILSGGNLDPALLATIIAKQSS